MRKKSLIASIVLTILNIFPTIFCMILNSGIVYEGEGSIGLIVIIPYSFVLLPIITLMFILSLIFAIKSLKSEIRWVKIVGLILTVVNVIIGVSVIVMFARIIPLFFK